MPAWRRFVLVSCVLALWAIHVQPAHGQSQPDSLSQGRVHITGYGLFEIRGQYGTIPAAQPPAREVDYDWWQPGRVGFWESHVEAGAAAAFGERITTRLAVSTTGDRADRDFAIWGNDVPAKARLKEASIRLDRVWSSRLAIEGGRQPVDYPLFTTYDYVGGRLIVRVSSHATVDWGQWQVFEGRNLDHPGQSSDDIDLWGPRLVLQSTQAAGSVYLLVHSKAGGSDGVGHNVKVIGLSAGLSRLHRLTADAAGVSQRGGTTAPAIGRRDVRAWAFRVRADGALPGRIHVSGEYWAGSGDRPGTPGVEEGFLSLGYRNTLEKSSLFYKPGLTDLRLFRGFVTGSAARITARLEVVRVGVGSTGAGIGTEAGLAIEYQYSEHARLRWRFGTTGNGQRMQGFELSFKSQVPGPKSQVSGQKMKGKRESVAESSRRFMFWL